MIAIGRIFIGTMAIYGSCARRATKALLVNWLLLPASIAAFLTFTIAANIVRQLNLGLAGGFLLGFAYILLLTLYFGWLKETSERTKLRTKDLLRFDYPLFSSIINVGFLLFIADLLMSSFVPRSSAGWIIPVLKLGICIVFNPVAEIIQRYGSDGLSSLKEAHDFVTENWIEWFVPFVLMLLPWIRLSPAGPLAALSQADLLLPAMPLVLETQLLTSYSFGESFALLGIILGVLLANWFMIFRALLFTELSTTPRRKRAYKQRNN